MYKKCFAFPPPCTHGQTALLSSIGLLGIHDVLKRMLEIESLLLLKVLLLTAGVMSMVTKILPTVPLEVSFHQSFWSTTCGGVVSIGFNLHQLTGQSSLLTNPPMRKEKFVSMSQLHQGYRLYLFSSFDRLKRVTAWTMRFVHNCHMRKLKRLDDVNVSPFLTVEELNAAEVYSLLHSKNILQMKYTQLDTKL